MSASIGYVGLICFALAWIPQSLETIRAGRCAVNRSFLALSAMGSFALTLYAYSRGDTVFYSLNALTTAGALTNIYFSFFPRIWIR
ncbi:MAG: lipid-A-disaccharide synthase N-terminal domain-containing protein [Elusimicrobia bacterium]|nr:lipid-A-disaccharide synthase N-terminal domain-containing protein [Elusimicrobiota bacterium]